jgi:hypothetical protein
MNAHLTHDECQRALAEDYGDHPAVLAHLATCHECSEFADSLAEVDRLLASIAAPPPPLDLADRIMRASREQSGS